jgi:integrase
MLFQTFPNKTLAKEWARKVEAEIATSRFLRRVEEEKHTLSEAIDRFLAENLSELSEQEQNSRRTHLNWWRDELGPLSLAAVTPAAIAEARAELLTRVSGATSNRYLAALSSVLNLAEKEWEWLGRNPVSKVRRRAESRGRVRFLSDDERKRLLKVCQASHDWRLYPLVLFALTTGARQGELLGLRWEDIDLENGRGRLQKTKNKDRRSISFPGSAGEVLREMAETPHESGYLFSNGDGVPTFPKKPWLAAVREAKIDNFRFHDLRHTAASYLAMSGATLPELAAFLGHRTLAMVQRYAHLTESHSESVAERMAQQFLTD